MNKSVEDRYCYNNYVVIRLIQEWEKYGRIIIAYDFDNTVFDYHGVGDTFPRVISLLRRAKELGAYLILTTCCDDSEIPRIREYLERNNIPCDIINDNAPFIPFKSRKIYYNLLLDDRAGLPSASDDLELAMDLIESRRRKEA